MNEQSPDLLFLLKRVKHLESKELNECLSLREGRVSVLFRPYHGRSSRVMQFYIPYRSLTKTRGELKTLKGLEMAWFVPKLSGLKLAWGAYLNELLSRLLPKGLSDAELFLAYQSFVESEGEVEFHACEVGWRLLEVIGFAPSFSRDQDGYPLDPQLRYSLGSHGEWCLSLEGGFSGEELLNLDTLPKERLTSLRRGIFEGIFSHHLNGGLLSAGLLLELSPKGNEGH